MWERTWLQLDLQGKLIKTVRKGKGAGELGLKTGQESGKQRPWCGAKSTLLAIPFLLINLNLLLCIIHSKFKVLTAQYLSTGSFISFRSHTCPGVSGHWGGEEFGLVISGFNTGRGANSDNCELRIPLPQILCTLPNSPKGENATNRKGGGLDSDQLKN